MDLVIEKLVRLGVEGRKTYSYEKYTLTPCDNVKKDAATRDVLGMETLSAGEKTRIRRNLRHADWGQEEYNALEDRENEAARHEKIQQRCGKQIQDEKS